MGNFNKQAYLAESLTSLLESTEKNIEICIVDDCSTDYSMDLLNFFAKKDKRIKLERNEVNLGVSKTYNRATSMVEGDIILVAASDDVYDHDRAKWAVKAFKKYNADLIYWPFFKAQERLVLDQSGSGAHSGMMLVPFEKKVAPEFDAEKLKRVDGQFIGHGFCGYRTDVGRKVKYREDLKHGCDHHFFLDCWKSGVKFQHIADMTQCAGTYRWYIDMVSNKFRKEILEQDNKLEKEFSNEKN